MPNVNEIFTSLKTDLAKGEHLNLPKVTKVTTLDHLKSTLSAKPRISDPVQRSKFPYFK
jgi:hypothetical protein